MKIIEAKNKTNVIWNCDICLKPSELLSCNLVKNKYKWVCLGCEKNDL